jgi:hypothetical protein
MRGGGEAAGRDGLRPACWMNRWIIHCGLSVLENGIVIVFFDEECPGVAEQGLSVRLAALTPTLGGKIPAFLHVDAEAEPSFGVMRFVESTVERQTRTLDWVRLRSAPAVNTSCSGMRMAALSLL